MTSNSQSRGGLRYQATLLDSRLCGNDDGWNQSESTPMWQIEHQTLDSKIDDLNEPYPRKAVLAQPLIDHIDLEEES